MHGPCSNLLAKGKGQKGIRDGDVTDVWEEVSGQGDSQVSLGLSGPLTP